MIKPTEIYNYQDQEESSSSEEQSINSNGDNIPPEPYSTNQPLKIRDSKEFIPQNGPTEDQGIFIQSKGSYE